VCLDELVQVHTEKLSRDAKMAAEVEALGEVDHTVLVVGIPFTQLLENVDFDQSLLMEPLLVTNDLDRFESSRLMVYAAHDLSETTLSEHINDFVSVGKMVSKDNVVIATFVVVAKVRCLRIKVAEVLVCLLCST